MCVSVCKCDVCPFSNYCMNMDFESVNKRFIMIYYIHSNWNDKVKPDTVDSPYWDDMYIEIHDSTNSKCKFTVENMY